MGVQALILAAGRGSRLGKTEGYVPKPLLQVGRRLLIEHMLDTLADAGIGPVYMVLGYSADEIREVVGLRAEYIINPRWKSTNSLCSFLKARPMVTGSTIVLNCDLLLHPEIINLLLEAGEDSIAFDSGSGDGREQMAVRIENGLLLDMGKNLMGDEASGENVGALYFSKKTMELLYEKGEEIIAAGGEKEWLGAAVKEGTKKRDIKAVDIAGLPWAEIDFPNDLNRARKEVWPAIQRSVRGNRPPIRFLRWIAPPVVLILLLIFIINGISLKKRLNSKLDWDTVDIVAGNKVKINAGQRHQSWWLLKENEVISSETIYGPDSIRIETRLVLGQKVIDQQKHYYIIELIIDDKTVNWYKLNAKTSKTATYNNTVIGKRERNEYQLSDGPHKVKIRLVASNNKPCFIRLRQVERDIE